MIEIQGRIQRAAESILENEALTADLDDSGAQVLLEWGVDLAQQITGRTIELDEHQAEEAMYQPMRALRKMLRGASKWAVDPQDHHLQRILKQAAVVYGPKYVQPDTKTQIAFTRQIPENQPERLILLKDFVEAQQNLPSASDS